MKFQIFTQLVYVRAQKFANSNLITVFRWIVSASDRSEGITKKQKKELLKYGMCLRILEA